MIFYLYIELSCILHVYDRENSDFLQEFLSSAFPNR